MSARLGLHSSQLQFTREGRALALGLGDAVALVDAQGAERWRVEVAEVQAIAAFADQLWAATRGGTLLRFARDGRLLGEHALLADPHAALVPTSIGGPAALWTAREPAMLVGDLGGLTTLHDSIESAIPISGRRFVRFAGSRLTLAAGRVVTLPGGARILDGAVVFEGASLALLTERSHGRELVIVALASGVPLQTVALAPGPVRIAARRGLAVVRDAERRLVLVDLRQARHLGAVVTDDEVADFAVDPDGRQLAIRSRNGGLELVALGERLGSLQVAAVASVASGAALAAASGVVTRELTDPPSQEGALASSPRLAPAEALTATVPVRIPDPVPVHVTVAVTAPWPAPGSSPAASASSASSPPPLPLVDVSALEPRAVRPHLPRAAALAELDRELRSVMLWTLLAISRAWDTRRLGYGNEGHHPYEHEVAALVGRNAGFAPDYIEAAQTALAEHEAALAVDPHYRNAATPIAELSQELGLSAIAVDLLLTIAAPALLGDLARLYGILSNDPGRALVDELLVHQVLGGLMHRHDLEAELHPRAPLMRLGIVTASGARARPFAALEVSPVILARLRGEPPELHGAPILREADRALEALELAPGVLLAALEALAQAAPPGRPRSSPPEARPGDWSGPVRRRSDEPSAVPPPSARLAVRGRAGSGRRTLLAALAQRAGRSLGVIEAVALPRDGERFTEALRFALRRAQLAGLLPVVAGLEDVVLDSRSGHELAREVLAAHPGPLAVISPPEVRPPLPMGHVVIELPPLSETERLGVWQRALGGTEHWLRDAAGLASRYRVGPGLIQRAVIAATRSDPTGPCDDLIETFLRQSRDLRLADHARRVERLASWSELVLPADIMDSLRELIGRVRHRRTVFEEWGMSRTMATSRGLTALFQGQPGTGKTLVAGVIARELGLDLYQVDLSKVMSKWIGETERNLSTIFDAAEDGQVILLFDEADSLFAKRTEVRSSNDRYANLEVNYLLQRLDAFEGIAILTTNSGGSIDPAFKRRLSFRLSFPFPDEDTRAELWRAHLPRELPRAEALTFDALARKYQLSGGYIRNACLRAAFLAAQEETSLHQHHLERAVALEFAELGKLSTTGTIA